MFPISSIHFPCGLLFIILHSRGYHSGTSLDHLSFILLATGPVHYHFNLFTLSIIHIQYPCHINHQWFHFLSLLVMPSIERTILLPYKLKYTMQLKIYKSVLFKNCIHNEKTLFLIIFHITPNCYALCLISASIPKEFPNFIQISIIRIHRSIPILGTIAIYYNMCVYEI